MMITEAAGGWLWVVCDDNLITFWTRNGPPCSLAGREGRSLVLWEAPVVMVGSDSAEVEQRLGAGELVCPCGGGLSRWGHARPRTVRGVGLLRPRRARCVACRGTHVLLAVSCLVRRADAVEVIGAALRAKARVQGHRPIAARLGRPASTVRGWLRAFAGNAEAVRALCTGLLVELDRLAASLEPAGSLFADAVEVIGACAAAARRRLGVIGAVSAWQLASAVTGGRLLAPAGPSGVDQHELALGRGWLINNPRDSCAFPTASARRCSWPSAMTSKSRSGPNGPARSGCSGTR